MQTPIYFDYAATTPVDSIVAKTMQAFLTLDGTFGNAGSVTHQFGHAAQQAVDTARQQVASLLHAEPRDIIFTSGATEANNLALQGAAHFYQKKGKHIITCQTEHKAILDPCEFLAKQGFAITYIKPDQHGLLTPAQIANALRADTILVSIMHVNNETGVQQDIAAIAKLCRQHNVLFHSDAAQSVGKVPLDLSNTPIDLLSFSGHKIYAPKGIGALYVRQKPRVRLQPLFYGGGQERGLRSGTLPVAQIVALGKACALAQQTLAADAIRIKQLREHLLQQLRKLEGVIINGCLTQSWPGIISITFHNIDGSALMMALHELALSMGSACTSTSIESSHVLRAMGIAERLAHGTIRFSIGRFTTAQQIDYAAQLICQHVTKLRAMAPK